jgi:tripartite-type tricarboxylate transporter receptor subunit TctC
LGRPVGRPARCPAQLEHDSKKWKPEVVHKLASEGTKLLSSAAFQARLENAGVTPQIGEVKDVLAQRIQKDMIYWKPVIEEIGIKSE